MPRISTIKQGLCGFTGFVVIGGGIAALTLGILRLTHFQHSPKNWLGLNKTYALSMIGGGGALGGIGSITTSIWGIYTIVIQRKKAASSSSCYSTRA